MPILQLSLISNEGLCNPDNHISSYDFPCNHTSFIKNIVVVNNSNSGSYHAKSVKTHKSHQNDRLMGLILPGIIQILNKLEETTKFLIKCLHETDLDPYSHWLASEEKITDLIFRRAKKYCKANCVFLIL